MKALLFIAFATVFANEPSVPFKKAVAEIRQGSKEQLLKTLKSHPGVLKEQDEAYMTLLMIAVSEKNLPAVEVILKQKPALEVEGIENKTALELALEEPSVKMIEMLLKAGANPNHANKETGSTSLHRAVITENPELIQLLLKYKANPALKNKKGESAEDWAALRSIKLRK